MAAQLAASQEGLSSVRKKDYVSLSMNTEIGPGPETMDFKNKLRGWMMAIEAFETIISYIHTFG
jgi:hypothetical protein